LGPNLATTGLIIAASVLVAAGIAIYESPQVRAWVDQSRRKIAIALHSLGDEIQPRRPSESSDDFEERKRRREEIVRRNRTDLIKRAREEGVAVDLDELVKIGQDVEAVEKEMAERKHKGRTNSGKSFDELVGSDGMLRKDVSSGKTTGIQSTDNAARRRGAAGFAAGSALSVNPFDDSQVLFDQDDRDDAPSPKEFSYIEPGTRESSATIGGTPLPVSDQLIDLTPEELAFVQDLTPASPQPPQTPQEILSQADDTEIAAQSFYSFASSPPQSLENSAMYPHIDIPEGIRTPDNIEAVSTGTLTPRSEHSGFTTGASIVGSQADDIAVMSVQSDDDHDARSEAFSEGGFTDAGFSEAGFSEVGSQRGMGVMTPSSWTDVGSDDESEWGGQQGHVSQVHQ
jgi:hypothetical protein